MAFIERHGITLLLVVVFLLGALTLGGILWAVGPDGFRGAGAQEDNRGEPLTDVSPDTTAALTPPGVNADSIAQIVKQAGPAVVLINTEVTGSGQSGNPFLDDPLFRQFFGVPHPDTRQGGLGSGFIISEDGYILTNEHVVHNADQIKVTVTGYDQPLKAELVGSDYDLDLAVLKIDAGGQLPFLKLGNSDAIEVGSWVIAIGNPYGLDHTVTVGVISAKERPVTVEDRQYKNLLQTDASINPGNSGGPLLNLAGQVVGINTAINSEAQGIGFAIPTSTVSEVLDTLIKNGQVTRPWIGVYIQPLSASTATYLNLEGTEGALVSDVVPNGPAAKAGLQQGDVIVEFDGQKVSSPDALVEQIKGKDLGQKVKVVVVREGQRLEKVLEISQKQAPN